MMNGHGKSETSAVPRKSPNKVGPEEEAAAEAEAHHANHGHGGPRHFSRAGVSCAGLNRRGVVNERVIR